MLTKLQLSLLGLVGKSCSFWPSVAVIFVSCSFVPKAVIPKDQLQRCFNCAVWMKGWRDFYSWLSESSATDLHPVHRFFWEADNADHQSTSTSGWCVWRVEIALLEKCKWKYMKCHDRCLAGWMVDWIIIGWRIIRIHPPTLVKKYKPFPLSTSFLDNRWQSWLTWDSLKFFIFFLHSSYHWVTPQKTNMTMKKTTFWRYISYKPMVIFHLVILVFGE